MSARCALRRDFDPEVDLAECHAADRGSIGPSKIRN